MAQDKQVHADSLDPGPLPIEKEMDALSLDQALRDFDVANARVIDLTQRLVEVTQTASTALSELAALEAQHETLLKREAELRRDHEAMRSSFAFRLASKIWALRNAFNI